MPTAPPPPPPPEFREEARVAVVALEIETSDVPADLVMIGMAAGMCDRIADRFVDPHEVIAYLLDPPRMTRLLSP